MRILIKKLNHSATGQETGAILTADVDVATSLQQKLACEALLSDYAFTVLYPNQGLNIYQNEYVDTPSIVVIRDINSLPDTTAIHPPQQ
jgi:hypothetical protein